MTITLNAVASLHYSLTNDQGILLDSSEGRDPLAYLHGHGQLIPGLEKELDGKKAGDKFKATIAPEEAYGPVHEELKQIVPKAGFQGEGDEQLEIGMQIQVETNQGPAVGHVAKIDGEDVTLDLNHPLAGATLHFDVEVVEVREASEEEISHGHAHGAGGHQH